MANLIQMNIISTTVGKNSLEEKEYSLQSTKESKYSVFLPRNPMDRRACVLSHFSCVQLFVNPWTAACQAPLSTRFPRQEY